MSAPRYTVEQVAWDGPNGLQVGWATLNGPRYEGGEILDVYEDRETAEGYCKYMNGRQSVRCAAEPMPF